LTGQYLAVALQSCNLIGKLIIIVKKVTEYKKRVCIITKNLLFIVVLFFVTSTTATNWFTWLGLAINVGLTNYWPIWKIHNDFQTENSLPAYSFQEVSPLIADWVKEQVTSFGYTQPIKVLVWPFHDSQVAIYKNMIFLGAQEINELSDGLMSKSDEILRKYRMSLAHETCHMLHNDTATETTNPLICATMVQLSSLLVRSRSQPKTALGFLLKNVLAGLTKGLLIKGGYYGTCRFQETRADTFACEQARDAQDLAAYADSFRLHPQRKDTLTNRMFELYYVPKHPNIHDRINTIRMLQKQLQETSEK